jgi:rhamnogalacturonan endolyase
MRGRNRAELESLETRRLLALTNLWTFNDGTPNDSVGGAHATLFNGASVSNGRLFLQNAGRTSGAANVQYARLPAGVVPDSGSLTINAWYISFSNSPVWSRVFDFGNKSGTAGVNYLGYTTLSSGGDARTFIRPGSSTSNDVVATGTRADQGYQRMVTVVVDSAAQQLRLYLDGTQTQATPLGTSTLANINDQFNFLGRSLFDADPGFSGSIEEFRIYDEALTPAAVAGLQTTGPSRPAAVSTSRQLEALNRGLVGLYRGGGQVYLSWRLLGNDPAGTSFNLYRQIGTGAWVKRNATPITATTDFSDTGIDTAQPTRYHVRPVVGGIEQAASEVFTIGSSPSAMDYIAVPLRKPANGFDRTGVEYSFFASDASVGDLDGDGQYEIIQRWKTASLGTSPFPGPELVDGYRMDGTLLWRINLGTNVNVESDFMIVYDLDGDGKAEVVLRTADGSVSGTGQVIGDPTKDWMNGPGVYQEGWTVRGPEWLTVFSGQTGAILANAPFEPARGNIEDWGDNYGQRSRQTKGVVAYLDGQRPSIVITRGIYYGWSGYSAKTEMAAYNFRNGVLSRPWAENFRAAVNAFSNINSNFVGQGNHNMSVADVDFDGRDELVFGAMVVDDDGRPLASSGMEHGDALHVSDLDPSRPGLEVYGIHENEGTFDPLRPPGTAMYDPLTGRMIWGLGNGLDVGRGVSADIDPNFPGAENWSIGGPGGVRNAQGVVINANTPSSVNFAVWWDGDLTRELQDRTYIEKWQPASGTLSRVYTASGVATNESTKQFSNLTGDILGDWREEILWRKSDSTELRIYTTPIASQARQYTLMHDSQYRVAVAWQNQGYNQPAHPSFFLGTGMAPAPTPNMYTPVATDVAPAAPTGVTVTAINGGETTQVSWATVPGAATYRVKRADDLGGPYYTLATDLAGTSFTDTSTGPGGTYYYVVTAVSGVGAGRESGASAETVSATTFPWPWTIRDIGTLAGQGRATLDGGIMMVRSFAASSGDGLRMISQDLAGDHTLITRVDWKDNRIGAAGLMFRASTAANAAFVSMSAEPTDNDRLFVRWRNSTGGSTSFTVAYSSLPVWLKLERAGNNFTGSWSTDGANWTLVTTRAVTMSTTVPAGLFVSGSATSSTWTQFSNTSVINPANTAPTGVLSLPSTASEGSSPTVGLTGVNDSAADVAAGLRYSFDFDNNGTFDLTGSTSATTAMPANFLADGPAVRQVRVRVMDRYGAFNDYTGSMQVTNVVPTVTPPAGATVSIGATTTFTGSFADPGLDSWTGTVTPGDGTAARPITLNPDKTFSIPLAFATAGTFNVTVRISDDDGGIGQASFPVTAVVGPPPGSTVQAILINGGSNQRSMVTDLTVVFATAVTPQPGAFIVTERRGSEIGVAYTNPSGDGRTWLLRFSGAGVIGSSLFDGSYTLTLVANLLRDGSNNPLAGGNQSRSFHRLFGDADGDRAVSATEVAALNAARGTRTQPQYVGFYDFSNNGRIDNSDYNQILPRSQGRTSL